MDKTQIIKDILFFIYESDVTVSKFNNKVKFMNLAYPIARMTTWDEEKLLAVKEAMAVAINKLNEVNNLIEELNDPVMNLIQTYGSTDYDE